MKIYKRKIFYIIFTIFLIAFLNIHSLAELLVICDLTYKANTERNSIVIVFQEEISGYQIELIKGSDGLIDKKPEIYSNTIRFSQLQEGEYFVRLKNDSCQIIIGSSIDKSKGLIIE